MSMQDLVLNTCAPWGKWANAKRLSGYPLTPGMRVVTRVEALSDRFGISVPYGSLFIYDFKFRPRYGNVWRTNEILVDEQSHTQYTQKLVVGKVSVYNEFFLISVITIFLNCKSSVLYMCLTPTNV